MYSERAETDNDERWLRLAVSIAYKNAAQGGRPFGAVLVRHDEVLAEAVNEIHMTDNPTDHAELLLIRRASEEVGGDFNNCIIYASGHPCPMCLGAMYLCGISRVVYGASNQVAEPYGLSTDVIYRQFSLPLNEQYMKIRYLPTADVTDLYQDWKILNDRH